ncbi:MAG: phytanoyl-CoA dioxygenase family protein [Candidatus Latescibacterota bacterium]
MLTDEQIKQFQEKGYLVFERLIQGEKLAHYKQVFDALVERGRHLTEEEPHWSLELDDNGKPIQGFLHKVQGVCVVDGRVLDLAKEPEILDRVEALVGVNIDVFGTKFFPKLPNGGTSTHWHQDNYYFGTNSDRILSCGIYLEDSDKSNGCLRVVPGSHLSMEIVHHQKTAGMHGSWTTVDESQAVDLEIPAGTVVIFSANLLHGAYDNFSDRTRYSTAWHYVPGDLNMERFVRGEYSDRHIVRGN